MEHLQKTLDIAELLKTDEVIQTFKYFRQKWRYLDPDDLESIFNRAIMKAVRYHNPERRKFKTTLSKYINYEIFRQKPNNEIKFISDNFDFTQKREIEVAESSSLLYNKVSDWMNQYLDKKEREIILLRVFENLTWKEIASHIRCNEASAKNYFFNGISQLRYISKVEGIKLCDELDLA